jgi:alkylhydroperoxidase family enzyme
VSSPDPCRVELRADAGEDAELAAIYEQVARTAGGIPKLYQAVATSPPLLRGWIDFAWSLRGDAGSSRAVRELAILRTACLAGSDYVWRSHVRLAVRAGVGETQVAAVATWRSNSDAFDEATQAVFALTDELVESGAVSDPAWTSAASHFAPGELVEIVLTVSWYQHVARVVAALGVPLEGYHATTMPVPEEVIR